MNKTIISNYKIILIMFAALIVFSTCGGGGVSISSDVVCTPSDSTDE